MNARAAVLVVVVTIASAAAVSAQGMVDGKFTGVDTTGATYRGSATALRAKIEANAGNVAARKELVRVLSELGVYEEAEHVAAAGGAPLLHMLADVQMTRGQRDSAVASWQRALTMRTADSAQARLGIARAHYYGGKRADALNELQWFIDFYNNAGKPLTADELTAVGQAVTLLGVTDPQLFHDAVKAFEEASKADPKSLDSRIYESALFLDKFDSKNGTPVVEEALAIEPYNPRALVELARAKRFDGSDEAVVDVNHALGINPNLVSARVLKAELLASSEDYAGAQKEIDRALAVNPNSVDALAVQAGLAYLRIDRPAYEATVKRVAAIDPRDTKLLTKTSSMIADERRFLESIELAHKAIAIDSSAWDARTLAGLGSFRIGKFDDAVKELNVAFKGDPYNPWVKNTLDLLDTYPQYVTESSQRFDLLLNKSEADLIALYMEPLAEAAYDTFAARYKWTPPEHIRIEVYPRHADFSVRTVGLSGLGALGVSFGDILAMDSPSARKIGEFHWASTMWHEVAHTFTLGLSNMKIPRWFTEGISGWEEARGHAGWGDPITPSFLSAYMSGHLPPLSQLTPAFIRPAYPEQVIHAYAMAELVVDEIATTRGIDAIRKMVADFGDGKSQADVFKDILHATPEQYDAEFDAYMHKRFATQFAALQDGPRGTYAAAISDGRARIDAGDLDGAAIALQKAVALFPDYAGPGSPYELMVQLETKRGNDQATAQWLDRITQKFAQNYDAWVQLATVREKMGDKKAAATALEQAMYVHPYDPALHEHLAVLFTATGRLKDAVRERRAIVALKPVDKAAAYYQLALALEAAGDRAGAKTEVLHALETAPGYAAAQELLLRLQASK